MMCPCCGETNKYHFRVHHLLICWRTDNDNAPNDDDGRLFPDDGAGEEAVVASMVLAVDVVAVLLLMVAQCS